MNPKNAVSVYHSPSNSDAVKITRDSLKITLTEDGIPVLNFNTCGGKGTGQQQVPVSELPDLLTALESYTDGVSRTADAPLSAVEMLHATIATVEGDDSTVQFRLNAGKGQKPTRIAIRDIRGVVNMMRGSLDRINEIAADLVPSDTDDQKS